MRRVFLVLALVSVLFVVGCTIQQRETAGTWLGRAADTAETAAPFAGPWAPVAGLLSVILNGVAAVVVPKQSIQQSRLKRAIRELSSLLDEIKGSNNAPVADAAITLLAELDRLKDSAPQDIKKFLDLYDAVRKGLK